MTRRRVKRRRRSIEYGEDEDPDDNWDAMDFVDDGAEEEEEEDDDDDE